MNYLKDKKNLVIIGLIILIIVFIIFVILLSKNNQTNNDLGASKNFKGQIINDVVKIPETISINSNEGEIVPRGDYEIKIKPQTESEQVLITKAKFTLKEAYNKALPEVTKWSADQKLVFIKSNGALGLDGRSSSWQLVYNSPSLRRDYEIVIIEDQIVSQKELTSNVSGAEPPTNWYDSYEAIASLVTLPQFSDGTISALSFYYSNTDNSWAYGLANGDKTTSMWVK